MTKTVVMFLEIIKYPSLFQNSAKIFKCSSFINYVKKYLTVSISSAIFDIYFPFCHYCLYRRKEKRYKNIRDFSLYMRLFILNLHMYIIYLRLYSYVFLFLVKTLNNTMTFSLISKFREIFFNVFIYMSM